MNSFLFNHRFVFMTPLNNNEGPKIQEVDELQLPAEGIKEETPAAELTREAIQEMGMEEKREKFTKVYAKNHHHIDFLNNSEAEKMLGLQDLFDSEAIRIVYGSQRPDGKGGSAEATRNPDGNYYDTATDERISIYTGDIVAPQTLDTLINIENIPVVDLAEPEVPVVDIYNPELPTLDPIQPEEKPKLVDLPLVDLDGNEVPDEDDQINEDNQHDDQDGKPPLIASIN